MSKKAWIIFAAVCIALLGGLVYISNKDKVSVSKSDTEKILDASKASGNIGDHVFGNKDSKALLIEYGDFQCPGCGAAHPVVKELTEKYKDKVAFVFRNFPLSTIHPNARAAAATAEAAGLQGKYWQMHNKLFEMQYAWKDASSSERDTLFQKYADELGLDTSKFKKDYSSAAVMDKISFDTALGKEVNVTGTPTFFLNNKILSDIRDASGNIDKDKFEKALKGAMGS